jgi:hypothetical protein
LHGVVTSHVLYPLPRTSVLWVIYVVSSQFIFLLQRFLVTLRTLLLGGGGLLLLFGSEAVGFAGAGPLGCVIAAFVANRGWRAQGWNGETVSLDV